MNTDKKSESQHPKKVEVAKKVTPTQEPDQFTGYVLAPRHLFPEGEGGLPDPSQDAVRGPLEIKALFLRGARESDKKRGDKWPDGVPYQKWFTLSLSSCQKRLEMMKTRQDSCKQTENAVLGWPASPKDVRPITDVLKEDGLC